MQIGKRQFSNNQHVTIKQGTFAGLAWLKKWILSPVMTAIVVVVVVLAASAASIIALPFIVFSAASRRLRAIWWLRKTEDSISRLREALKIQQALGDYGSVTEEMRYSKSVCLVDDEGWADWELVITNERIAVVLLEGRGVIRPNTIVRIDQLERIEYVRASAAGHTAVGHQGKAHIGSRRIDLDYLGLRLVPSGSKPIDVAQRTSYVTSDDLCGYCDQSAQPESSETPADDLWGVLTSSGVPLVENATLVTEFNNYWREPWV